MIAKLRSAPQSLLPLLGLLLLAGLVVWLAPLERTLGAGIKVVYIHVALIWTGMTALSLIGLLGLGVMATGQESIQTWSQAIGWVGLIFFAAGIAMSMVAANVNWGGVFWDEPRFQATFRVLAVAIIILIVNGWPIASRLKGLLSCLLTGFLAWSILTTPLVLHPQSPVRTSPSTAIRLTFFALFVLSVLMAAWLVWLLRQETEMAAGRKQG